MTAPRLFLALVSGFIVEGTLVHACAQSFTLTLGDTVRSGLLGSEIIFEGMIRNTSGTVLTLAFVRTENALPAGWQSAMCIDVLCFAPSLDSVALTSDFGCSPLRAGDSCLFSVHVTPQVTPGTGTVRVVAKNVNNPADMKAMRFTAHAAANAVGSDPAAPAEHLLLQNFPNPWNPSTRIRYAIVEEGVVSLMLYDRIGRAVAVLINQRQPAGIYEVELSTKAGPGQNLASGVYWYRLINGDFHRTRSMVLIK